MVKYWCVNFDSEECLKHGIERNLWMMQYQYADDHENGFQSHKPAAITNNWQQLKNISRGDWLVAYLKKNRYFAFGKVIMPRHKKKAGDATTTIGEYLNTRNSHAHKNKFVYFKDAPVLYEDFTDRWRHPADGLFRYPQRIDVEEWQSFVPEGIETVGLGEHKSKKPHLAVTQIDMPFFRRIQKELQRAETSSFTKNSSRHTDELPDDAVT